MAHYGDPEAHRCLLEEVAARPTSARLFAYLRAAVMGSQGSEVGLQQLRRFPGAVEQPTPHLKIPLALLSMTVLASAAKPAFRAEQQRVYELLAREREALMQQGELLKNSSHSIHNNSGSLPWAVPSGPQHLHVNFASSDMSSASANVAAAAAAAGGVSSVLSSSPHHAAGELGGDGSSGAAGDGDALTPVERWEQSMDTLNYCEAYANYLSGFTVLWYELFGPHYYYDATDNMGCDSDGEDGAGGTLGGGREAATGTGASGGAAAGAAGERASNSAPASPQPQPLPQVPHHLYAVRWREMLTPQRRAWFQGLHNVVKELLVRLLTRELPLELYTLFIQYANLSLRVYLLQTLAEVFEWTSHHLDVLCYVHVMRQSYSIQCEMSQLQRIWASFGLFDNRFISDCREFNKMYTESQGAFSEQKAAGGADHVRGPPGGSSSLRGAAGGATGTATTAATAAAARALTSGVPPAVARASSHDRTHARGLSGRYGGGVAAAAVEGAAPGPTAAAIAVGEDDNNDVDAAVTAAAAAAAAARGAVHRVFPLRSAEGNGSSDVAQSSASTSPEDDALSSASEAATADGDARRTKRAVYLPLFYTCCCFTWILQRSFWSMYGRCSLLLESCLGNEEAPQVLRIGTSGVEEGESALFPTSSSGTRRRTTGGVGLSTVTTTASAAATSDPGLAQARSSSQPPSLRPAHASAAAGKGVGGGRRVATAAQEPRSTAAQSAREAGEGAGLLATTAAGGAGDSGHQSPSHTSPAPEPRHRQGSGKSHSPAPEATPPHTSRLAALSDSPSPSPPAAGAASARSAAHEAPRALSSDTTPWGRLLSKLTSRRRSRDTSQSTAAVAAAANPRARESGVESPAGPASGECGAAGEDASPLPVPVDPAAAAAARLEESIAAAIAASAVVTSSGAPFELQYPHRAREMELYDDPSGGSTPGGDAADPLFFEEFHFLRETGCYVLSHALRNLTCYPRYATTLLIVTDNTRRPGRVTWCDHKYCVLSQPCEDKEERRGLTPWVLNAVIPHTRLSADVAVRAQQEERLLQHVVFQVAGRRRSRVSFCTSNAVFYVLNGDRDMDGGRVYFALHLHVPNAAAGLAEHVRRAESQWAFRELGELLCGWAMAVTCNEALRVAFQVGPVEAL